MTLRFLTRITAGAASQRSIKLGCKGCAALAVLLLLACSTAPPVRDDTFGASPPRYSLVFIVHGDGKYLFHDTLGVARRADEEIVAKARAIAEQNPNAEVLIFHEIKRRHVLFLIPRRDGRAYHYRNGRLVAQECYWRDQGESRFDPEVRLYHQFAGTRPRPSLQMLFYFGHELPEFASTGYDASYSKRPVTVDDLAAAVKNIAGDSSKVDLLALVTCFGGTPYTIGVLAPYARFIVASPENLHLSYFNLALLAPLDIGSEDGAVAAFADRFARNAFAQLERDVQTAISVVVYDVDSLGGFVTSVAGAYRRALTAVSELPVESVEHCDCADDSAYAMPGMSEGLTVLYRSPRFGRAKQKQTHSGWECWRIVK